MRKLLIALAMIGASVFIAVPAVAQDEAAGPSESGTSDENIPEETPSREPPAENPLIPQDSEDEETEPETAVKTRSGLTSEATSVATRRSARCAVANRPISASF